MEGPADLNLPFFAYGLFRPGQIAYFQLRDFVQKSDAPVVVRGRLLIRDGLPIIDPSGNEEVVGALISFKEGAAPEAYDRIAGLEPEKQYRWDTATVDTRLANILMGRSPKRGSVTPEDQAWDGWADPLFTSALDVVQETIDSNDRFAWDLKPMFRLQMAYLLLWSAIERYLSLRYDLSIRVTEKINKLIDEPAFVTQFQRLVSRKHEIVRADRPDKKTVLDPASPQSAVDYYYQIRSNITHRGKSVPRDHEALLNSASELLRIFRHVLGQAKIDAES